MKKNLSVFWFRRDLRLEDNCGLFHALQSGNPVLPVFIFDKEILDELPPQDARVDFIHRTLHRLQDQLAEMGSTLVVKYGKPSAIWASLLTDYAVEAVYTNHDYEPYASQRDQEIKEVLVTKGLDFFTFKDQVIFEKKEILTNAEKPYTVFTPYSKKWKASLVEESTASYPSRQYFDRFYPHDPVEIPTLGSMGFQITTTDFPSSDPEHEVIRHYNERRDFPAKKGTTRIGIHLRFGTVSIRKLVTTAQQLNETYLNELIWREFYMQILWNFPHVTIGPFRKEYAAVRWRDAPEDFEKWREGKTGYPLVDAGMRELMATGYMHNRVRMVTASFLTKHLLINWQQGENWFAEKLLDFELASNNGGWQWAAGCGTDAAPYFRIFNPESQMKKFDPELKYVRKWVPEYETPMYPRPMVDHKAARERCLEAYKLALKPNG